MHWTNINVILDGNNSPTPHVFRAVPSQLPLLLLLLLMASDWKTMHWTPDIPTSVVAGNTHMYIIFCQISENLVYVYNTFLRKHSFFLIFKTSSHSHSHISRFTSLCFIVTPPPLHFSSAERWDMFSSLLMTINQWWPCLCVTFGTSLSSVLPNICSPNSGDMHYHLWSSSCLEKKLGSLPGSEVWRAALLIIA